MFHCVRFCVCLNFASGGLLTYFWCSVSPVQSSPVHLSPVISNTPTGSGKLLSFKCQVLKFCDSSSLGVFYPSFKLCVISHTSMVIATWLLYQWASWVKLGLAWWLHVMQYLSVYASHLWYSVMHMCGHVTCAALYPGVEEGEQKVVYTVCACS